MGLPIGGVPLLSCCRTENVASTVNVIRPEANQRIGMGASAAAELPQGLYLLHGYSDDHSI